MLMWLYVFLGACGAIALIAAGVMAAEAWRFYTNDADDIDWDNAL